MISRHPVSRRFISGSNPTPTPTPTPSLLLVTGEISFDYTACSGMWSWKKHSYDSPCRFRPRKEVQGLRLRRSHHCPDCWGRIHPSSVASVLSYLGYVRPQVSCTDWSICPSLPLSPQITTSQFSNHLPLVSPSQTA